MRRVVREREPDPRLAVLRGFAAPPARFAVKRFGAGLLREAAAPDDFAAVERDFVPLVDFARDVDLRALALRAPVDEREVPREEPVPEPALALEPSSADHLPDMTRCAASATASAMIEPNLVALDMTLLAAAEAVSAASSPASRILRRAAGLALIAAAAAARPAASISLLIAAFASLSTVLFPDEADRLDVDVEAELEELFRGDFLADFAIAFSPSVAWGKTL